jgi:site-specific DNA-cytosine methylase
LPSHRKDNVDTTKELPTVIAFCAGYGGIERGLDLAGLEHRVIAYVEIEAFAIANLVNKMEAGQLPPAPIYTDLKTFPAHLFRDRVDLITGGYPCQPFSAAGQRKGTDDPRHLWPYILDHIRSIRPVQCFFENVEGHISLGLSTVISDLEEDGYRATWGIFSAAEVGAPHQRKRVYILGNSEHYGSSTSEIGGGASSTSNNTTQGQNEAIKSQRASQPDCGGDLSGAADMGHSQNNRCAGCRETIKRERSENHIKRPDQDLRWQSQRSSQTLADSEGKFSKRRIAEGVASWKPEEAIGDRGAFESVADTSGEGLQGSQWLGKARKEGISRGLTPECSDQLADTICSRSETGIPGQERYNKERDARVSINCGGEHGRWQIGMPWPPEPGVGRVVDGCADRVDRIRMLGNGVVPQTAAKAWGILSKRLN